MFELRRGTPFDREALAAMYRSFEPKGASLGLPPRGNPERWLDSLGGYANFLVVAEGRVVAHAVLAVKGHTGEVAVFVHQDFRRRGLGKLLLAELINEAHRQALKSLWGITESDNVSMLRLASSLDFLFGDEPGKFHLELEALAEPIDEKIRRRAYEIYLGRGGTPGRETDDWLQAECEFCARY